MSDQIVVLKMSELSSVMSAVADQAVEKAMRRLPMRDQPRPFHVNIKQACEITGFGRTKIDTLIKTGILRLNKGGLIPISQIDEMMGI